MVVSFGGGAGGRGEILTSVKIAEVLFFFLFFCSVPRSGDKKVVLRV